jgi:hypothetical protein
MGKYEPLSRVLSQRDVSRVRMSFNEIEKHLGFKLPRSAYEYEAWWSNNGTGHSHAKAWLESGWRTEEVDISGKKVTFARAPAASDARKVKSDPWGCMVGTVTVMPGTDLTAPSEGWIAEKEALLNE